MKLARARLQDGTTTVAVVEEGGIRPLGVDDLGSMLSILLDPGSAASNPLVSLTEVTLLSPLANAPSVRDFMVFEEHVANARERTGRDVPAAWYEAPAFYFTNPAALIGPEDPVTIPRGSRAFDLELEVACVIGREVVDAVAEDPACIEAIAGFFLMNDWSARDLQVKEMGVGLGPVKGKDAATSIGPWIVTKDELPPVGRARWSCPVEAFVNGRRLGGADISGAHFDWAQMVARASENTRLVPGDVLGSGTVGTGCILELRELGHRDDNPWLRAGDVVELRGGPLGVLRTRVVSPVERAGEDAPTSAKEAHDGLLAH